MSDEAQDNSSDSQKKIAEISATEKQLQEKLEELATEVQRLRDIEKINLRSVEHIKVLQSKLYDLQDNHNPLVEIQKKEIEFLKSIISKMVKE